MSSKIHGSVLPLIRRLPLTLSCCPYLPMMNIPSVQKSIPASQDIIGHTRSSLPIIRDDDDGCRPIYVVFIKDAKAESVGLLLDNETGFTHGPYNDQHTSRVELLSAILCFSSGCLPRYLPHLLFDLSIVNQLYFWPPKHLFPLTFIELPSTLASVGPKD